MNTMSSEGYDLYSKVDILKAQIKTSDDVAVKGIVNAIESLKTLECIVSDLKWELQKIKQKIEENTEYSETV